MHLLLRPIHLITDTGVAAACVTKVEPPEHVAQSAWGDTIYLAHFSDWHFEGTTPEPARAAVKEEHDSESGSCSWQGGDADFEAASAPPAPDID